MHNHKLKRSGLQAKQQDKKELLPTYTFLFAILIDDDFS
jgi:hypothetical protein